MSKQEEEENECHFPSIFALPLIPPPRMASSGEGSSDLFLVFERFIVLRRDTLASVDLIGRVVAIVPLIHPTILPLPARYSLLHAHRLDGFSFLFCFSLTPVSTRLGKGLEEEGFARTHTFKLAANKKQSSLGWYVRAIDLFRSV